MTNYDTWLTTDRTYEANVAAAEAFFAWCHDEGRDPDDPMTELVWEYRVAEWNRRYDEEFAEYMAECEQEGF